MRIAIAGAGNVGRSIARELIANGHEVLLMDRDPHTIKVDSVPGAEWLQIDACELQSLEDAQIEKCDVAIAATGDDKANLVHSLLARTEFGVPRTVARVNHPGNEWMFDEVWGVDVAVSTPRIMSALVEEAVSTGDLVRLFTFNRSTTNLAEIRLPATSQFVDQPIEALELPQGAVLLIVMRDGQPVLPEAQTMLAADDQMLFVVDQEAESNLSELFVEDIESGDEGEG